MSTPFGKAFKKIRIDKSLLLGNVAKMLNISASYLSSIESGDRDIPDNLLSKLSSVSNELGITKMELSELETAILHTKKAFKIIPGNQIERNILAGFARKELNAQQLEAIEKIINDKK